jgi:hypothetical protein
MRMLARVACVVTAAVAAGSAAPAAQSRSPLPTVPQLLAAAAKYVAEYDKKFSAVVSEEKYEQVVTQSTGFRAQQRRTLVSDVILINAGDAGWISLRDVYQVDGSPVRDHTDRLLKLLTNPAPDAYQQALRLAQEGARFNIGSMSRSINVPSTALRFVRQENQRHSSFSVAGMKTIDGVNTAELAFTETATPRLIRSPADAPADGKVWLEPASGRIVQTELSLKFEKSSSAKITVHYGADAKIGMWVPVRMDEVYILALGQVVSGRADYRNFRTFSVDVNTIIK